MKKPTRHRERPRQEHRDLNLRGIVLVALGVLATVLIVAGIGRFLTGVSGPARAGATETSIARPKWLASDPAQERAAFESEQRERLNSYGWVDRNKGVAHMPIERAMQLRAVDAGAAADPPKIGWTQHLGATLPLQLPFLNESGRRVMLDDYFHNVPVVMVFAYLSCSRLCPEVLTGVDQALRDTGLAAGRDYSLLVLSIDPHDSHRSLNRSAHFLTSPDGAVSQVASAAGFHYVRDGDEMQFGHAAGFLIATPRGTISRYFLGVRYPAAEIGAALLAAHDNKVGNLAERLLLLCYTPDGNHTARSAMIIGVLRALVLVGLLVLIVLVCRSFIRRERAQ